MIWSRRGGGGCPENMFSPCYCIGCLSVCLSDCRLTNPFCDPYQLPNVTSVVLSSSFVALLYNTSHIVYTQSLSVSPSVDNINMPWVVGTNVALRIDKRSDHLPPLQTVLLLIKNDYVAIFRAAEKATISSCGADFRPFGHPVLITTQSSSVWQKEVREWNERKRRLNERKEGRLILQTTLSSQKKYFRSGRWRRTKEWRIHKRPT